MSVWVEILCTSIKQPPNPSRSTWACELKLISCQKRFHFILSRSTWACELKLYLPPSVNSTWCVTLHVSVWVEIPFVHLVSKPHKSRSTWACELKCHTRPLPARQGHVTLHVSVWVEISSAIQFIVLQPVTLHVSVWVEIYTINKPHEKNSSRSTWACELKLK